MQLDFQWRLKKLDDSGSFTGLASTYGPPADWQGDIVENGAFTQSIAHQGKGYPLLFAHDQSQPLGLAKVSDSPAGLMVDGSLLLDDANAARVHKHMKNGSIKGLSIGYSLPRGEGKIAWNDDGTQTLKEIHLHEISLVAVPANQRAQVTSVKSLNDAHLLLRNLRDATQPDVLAQLQGINATLQQLLNGDDDEGDDDDEPDEEELAALKQLAVSLKSLVQ